MHTPQRMGTVLKSLIGRKVVVFTLSQSGYKDEGIVREVDEQALRLEVGDPSNSQKPLSQLYFPLTAIRLIRRLD